MMMIVTFARWNIGLSLFTGHIHFSNFSVRRSPTMRPQQDFSKFSCSCWCPPLLSCSFLVPLGPLLHYPSTSLVVFQCFLFPSLVHIGLELLPIFVSLHPCYVPEPRQPSFPDCVYQCNLLSQLFSDNLVPYLV